MRKAWTFGTRSFTFNWGNFTLLSGQAPDTDTVIPGDKVDGLHIQGYTDLSTNTSGDIDFYLISSPDNSSAGSYDTEKYAPMNLGDNQIKSMLANGGPLFFKMRASNNATATIANLKAIVTLW